jgi:hypothetical protein
MQCETPPWMAGFSFWQDFPISLFVSAYSLRQLFANAAIAACGTEGGLASMGGTYQAEILVLTRAVESSRLEPHLVCADPVGDDPTTAIANKPYFDHWLPPFRAPQSSRTASRRR